jgi:site-specific DNA-methyltransferase (adenine-specific)
MVRSFIKEHGETDLQTLYASLPDVKPHSMRARIYENLGSLFRRIRKGVYIAVQGEASCLVVSGDAWEEIRKLPSGSVDAIITDPPYPWLDAHVAQHTTTRPRMRWDFEKREIDKELGFEMYRVLKEGAHAFFFVPAETGLTKPFIDAFLGRLTKCGFVFNKRFIWDRVLLGMGYNGRARYEGILFLSKGERRMPCDLSIPDVLAVPQSHHRHRAHPTEKPVSLIEKLVLFATRTGEVVLDLFSGSCSTGIAALRLGRSAICFEKSEQFVEALA